MRHILHEILARYLDSDQHEFDTSPRELWPSERFTLHPRSAGNGLQQAAERGGGPRAYRELEPQN